MGWDRGNSTYQLLSCKTLNFRKINLLTIEIGLGSEKQWQILNCLPATWRLSHAQPYPSISNVCTSSLEQVTQGLGTGAVVTPWESTLPPSHLTLLQCGTCPGAEGGKFLLQCRLLPRGQCLEPLLLPSSSPPIHSCDSSMVLINLTDFSFTLDPAWFPKGFCIVLFYYFIFILFLISATHLLS